MSDRQTMKQHLLREIHLDPDTTDANSQVGNDVDIAIIEAIRFNRKYRLGFNDAWYTFTSEVDVDRYPLPVDYLGLVQDSVYTVPSYDYMSKTKLKSIPLQQANQVRQSSVASIAYRESGPPYAFAIDTSEREFVLLPIPSSGGDIIEFQYIADIGTPVFKYTGSAWAFYEPQELGSMDNASTTLSTTFTNAWFQEAYWLTFYRAAQMLLLGPYGGSPGAEQKAQSYAALWQEQLNALRSEVRMMRSATEIRAYF